MIDEQLTRARILLDQGRYDLALDHYRAALALDAESSEVHLGIATCLLAQDDLDGARDHARQALGLDPEEPFAHWILGRVELRYDKPKRAREHAEAMRSLLPTSPAPEALFAEIAARQKRWQEAIDAAERGLAHDPDDEDCLNLRSHALAQTGRHTEAQADIEANLRRNADDPATHANAGWNKLRSGDHRQARIHFTEALRLQPGNDWARAGLIESIKAGNLFYRKFFQLILWLGSIPTGKFFIIMIATVIGRRYLNQLGNDNPAMEIFANFIIFGIFSLFVVLMILQPLGNLAILLHPLGRHALLGREKFQAILLGLGMLTVGVTAVALLVALNEPVLAANIGLFGALLCFSLTLASIPQPLVAWSRAVLVFLAVAFTGLLIGYVVAATAQVQDLAQLNAALRAVGIDGLQAVLDGATLTPEQEQAVTPAMTHMIERKWLHQLAPTLLTIAMFGLVGLTWIAGALIKPKPS